ncbi:helix-turn-helix domain-containing protein [Streptomyces kebangsaanensis]|uniref:helix-turn-helix domain-containing protein n=1 Tax=Streptomyces kebangsaanensis TaxID=864058 RepID=UPI000B0F3711|nr:helix-turn-helix domain-containing protein [Streptomyces kebangsaanensis]
MADLTQEALAERSGLSADLIKKLEQKRKHSARLPTLHALAKGLGVELTAFLGDPPGVPSTGDADPPRLVALRRAVMPPLFAPLPEPSDTERLTIPLLRREIADAWGPQPPVAGYVHRLMVDRSSAQPGTGRFLLRAAERRVAAAGRAFVRLDCLAGNTRLNAGYRVVGHKAGKPQPGGAPKSFTLLEKTFGPAARAERQVVSGSTDKTTPGAE